MIAETEQIEQPGINAVDHPCEMKVEIPGDDGEPSTFKKCLQLAKVQCTTCTAWVCGTVELDHAIVCVRCDKWFCPEDYAAHRIENRCQEVAA
jgi:hypothetical protein